MANLSSHHATIFVAPGAAEPIEAVRRAWDPIMAAQIAAHITLIHPRTSSRGRAFWDRPQHEELACEFTATEVAITAFDGTAWVVVEKFPLRQAG